MTTTNGNRPGKGAAKSVSGKSAGTENTYTTDQAQVLSPREFAALEFAFLHAINADRLVLAIDLKVALALTKYFNRVDGGRAYPSAKTLAADTGLSERSVLRTIDRLKARGHLYVIPGQRGRNRPGQYWMIVKPAEPCRFSETEKTGKSGQNKTGNRGNKTGTATPENLVTNLKTPLGDVKNVPSREGEREAADAAGHPGGERAALVAALPPESEESKQAVAVAQVLPSVAASFQELRTVWRPRPWAEPDIAEAFRLFAYTVNEGVAPEIIITAAIAWVEANDPRFLPSLASWLGDQRWASDPPKRRTASPHKRGNSRVGAYARAMAEQQ